MADTEKSDTMRAFVMRGIGEVGRTDKPVP